MDVGDLDADEVDRGAVAGLDPRLGRAVDLEAADADPPALRQQLQLVAGCDRARDQRARHGSDIFVSEAMQGGSITLRFAILPHCM